MEPAATAQPSWAAADAPPAPPPPAPRAEGSDSSLETGAARRGANGAAAPGPLAPPALAPHAQPPLPGDAVPVYVMLPLDAVNARGAFRFASSRWFAGALRALARSGVRGVAVDVWWGAVERAPRRYDWAGYRALFDAVAAAGLRLQAVMSFHGCGGNVGDSAVVPLPPWVLAAGEADPDIYFTDRPSATGRAPGRRNPEVVSLFAAAEPGLLEGRSPLRCYADFMAAFRDEFAGELGWLVEEVVVGAGPCGELRYPAYPEANGWRFPGVGEFQAYDRRALASLAAAAAAAGRPEWGNAGPADAGSYNCTPDEAPFFSPWSADNWESPYGAFFLGWYAGALLEHGDRLLGIAASVFNARRRPAPASPPASSGGGGGAPASRSASAPDLGRGAGGDEPPLSGAALDAALAAQRAAGAPARPSRPPSLASLRSSDAGEAELAALAALGPPRGPPVELTLKIAGVHWWYRSRSHAAELTAGYYNAGGRDGYAPIAALCARHGAGLALTCVEMCDAQHPPEALCGPEGLLRQAREAAAAAGVPLAGENALPCFMPHAVDEIALQRIIFNTQPWGTPLEQRGGRGGGGGGGGGGSPGAAPGRAANGRPLLGHLGGGGSAADMEVDGHYAEGEAGEAPPPGQQLPPMRAFTFLRLSPEMMEPEYQERWGRFMILMQRNAARFKSSSTWRSRLGLTGQ